ncbi:MAG: galactose-1-phosphate uridylyltransferase [Planctomycetota bacterium]|jgi:UDPglucose--hexose-1-phosphate uridylyltransferase
MTWEERWHPLRREWVIIAAHRQDRPWTGETMKPPPRELPAYDPNCYLCPDNLHGSCARNPQYDGIYVIDNDYPCVGMEAPSPEEQPTGIYRCRPAQGRARVLCYAPEHNMSLAELEESRIEEVLRAMGEQYQELGAQPEIAHVLIFENKGEAVGTSNPHPHCQIYATNFVFKTIETEAQACAEHLAETRRILFQEIIAAEINDGRRILHENDSAIAFVPYFARYAYEVFVAPKETHPSLAALSDKERTDLSRALKHVLVKLENLWEMPFPYVMPLHQAPTDGGAYEGFHFHIEIHPPLRKPDLLKYLAGPEIGGGNFLSDTSPEEKAAELRAQPNKHYKA